jgi:hypothetical protein
MLPLKTKANPFQDISSLLFFQVRHFANALHSQCASQMAEAQVAN